MVEAARQRSSSKKGAYHSSNEKIHQNNGNQLITVTPFMKMVPVVTTGRPSVDVKKNSVTPTNKTAR
jgi:hypothetical protein